MLVTSLYTMLVTSNKHFYMIYLYYLWSHLTGHNVGDKSAYNASDKVTNTSI